METAALESIDSMVSCFDDSYLVMKNSQGIDILAGKDLVEGAKTLAQFNVKTSTRQGHRHNPVGRPLMAWIDGCIVLGTVLRDPRPGIEQT